MNFLSKDLENYSIKHTKQINPILDELEAYTKGNFESSQMMIGPLEGKFLQLLVVLSKAKRILEIGTFTGYSSICMADALRKDGQVISIDINEETSEIAQRFAQKAKLEDKINFVIGDAKKVLKEIDGPIDLIFVDADKASYLDYYELALKKLKPAGFIIFDNMLWSGNVLNPKTEDDITLNKLNDTLLNDKRVENFLLPLRDGIQIVQKL